ncbi:MAG: 6-phosphofructokinase [Magnetococcales bacterium]|nr:6-phosphofructokinase [Magnetococcales bacterium]NGZ26394.1 6-phosphofructokinase [Magnetococcales bacterium]
MESGNLLIAQGGGPTAVINQSLVGAVLAAHRHPRIRNIYGAQNGVRGILEERFVNLGQETSGNLLRVAATPGSALGSTRDKPDRPYCQRIFQVLKTHNIRYFFYIGGNDSSETLRILQEYADGENYPLIGVHIPKTIDNDLECNDHTPGFPSAARFVAQAFAGADLDNYALPGVYVGVVMGRHAGFLTAASAGLRQSAEGGPHLIYLPERTFSVDSFLKDVNSIYKSLGRCVIAVSEGIHDADGVPMIAKLQATMEKDAHGNVQLSGTGALADLLTDTIKRELGIKRVRGDTFGYLQRSFLGVVSPVDQLEAREVGEKACHFALDEGMGGSVAIKRVGQYVVDYSLEPLEHVAGKTRVMPDAYISSGDNHITDDFQNYLRPLLGNDLPIASRLRAPLVAKLLTE